MILTQNKLIKRSRVKSILIFLTTTAEKRGALMLTDVIIKYIKIRLGCKYTLEENGN